MTTVLFDPGYQACTLGISENIEFIYNVFESSYMPLKQKKFQFSLLVQKLKTMLKKSTGFYLGCLLWATYIKKEKSAQIENNPCLNEKFIEKEAFEEIDFLINFIKEKFPKDSKFYINKIPEIDARFLKVLEIYKNFVKMNNGFVSLKTTDELNLPSEIKSIQDKDYQKIKDTIDNAINSKDLAKLYEVYDLILD